MALLEERFDANARIASLLDRIRALGEASGRWLAIWTVATAVLVTAGRLGPLARIEIPAGLSAIVYAFCACAALGAGLYYFAMFVMSRRMRDLLHSAALLTIGSGAGLQGILDSASARPALDDRLLTTAVLCGAVALCGAAYSRTEWRPATRAGAWLQLSLSTAFVCAFPVAAFPYVLEGLLLRVTAPAYAATRVLSLIAAGFLVVGLIGYYREHRLDNVRRAAVCCFFLVPLIFSVLARAISSSRTDAWGNCAQVLFLATWIVFVTAVSIEQAVANKDASDRLHELEALHEVSWSLVGAAGVNELMDLLAETVRDRVGAAIGIVYLATDLRDALQAVAVSGPDIVLDRLGAAYDITGPGFRPGFHTGHTVQAFKTGSVQTALDVHVDVELVPWRMLARENGCAVSLPLLHHGEAFGVVSLYFSDRAQLTPQRLKFLVTVTAAASPAIASAHASTKHDGFGEEPPFARAA